MKGAAASLFHVRSWASVAILHSQAPSHERNGVRAIMLDSPGHHPCHVIKCEQ